MVLIKVTFVAFILDLLLGDPRYSFHPVRLIGKLARLLERKINKGSYKILKGALSSLLVYGTVIFSVILLRKSFSLTQSPYLILFLEGFLLYTTFALKSLNDHVRVIKKDLKNQDLKSARLHLSYIVGRKTDTLNEKEICRAVIESVSENLVDGVTAPLFFALLFGLEGAFLYKAINTLDSLWGHRNDRFEQFGKFAAVVDDIVNYIPSRLTAPIISLCALPITGNSWNSLKTLFRDGKKHPSPNSGLSEAAMAGALGIQLGGENIYEGYSSFRQYLGQNQSPLNEQKISKALFIINLASVSFLLIMSVIIINIQSLVAP